MFDKQKILALLEEGKSAEDIAQEFSNVLNTAEKEHKLALQKTEARNKIKSDYADDLAALLVKFNDDMGFDFKGSELMDFATGFINGFDEAMNDGLEKIKPKDRKSKFEKAGWTVDTDEYKETPHGFSSFFKAHKEG